MTDAEINDASNLVRISTFKHWELNSWYETPLPSLNGQTPRSFLVGKSAEEQRLLGIEGLKQIGVLTP